MVEIEIMKKILMLIALLAGTQTYAQQIPKTPVAPKPNTGKGIVIPKQTYQVSTDDIMALANATWSTELSDNKTLSKGGLSSQVIAAAQSSPVLKQAAVDKVTKGIFGDGSPKEFGITYTSLPVKNTYDAYIGPFVEVYQETSKENMLAIQPFIIVNEIVALLTKSAQNNGVFLTPGSIQKLQEEIRKEFKAETFPDESVDYHYFEDNMSSIFSRVASSLSHCMIYKGDKCHDDFSDSFFFLCGNLGKVQCALAVSIAKVNMSIAHSNAELTKKLTLAEYGILFDPVTSWKYKSYVFDVYATNLPVLQTNTTSNNLYKYYDPDFHCPSTFAFGFLKAYKVRSATINKE